MAEKDLTTKILEEYNDVFADIINVLIFNGEKRVLEDDLENAVSISQYKADNSKLHQLERDTAKYWVSDETGKKVRLAIYGLENQAALDNTMPMRVIGYDGASYRAQLLDDAHPEHCPVITLVLNFTERKWHKFTSLYDCITVPNELKPYVNDYKINVVNVQYLEKDTIDKFTSDFQVVAEHFMKTRLLREHNIPYEPSTKVIRHVDEFLKMLAVFTNDKTYEKLISSCQQKQTERGEFTMCEVVNRFKSEGRAEGRAEEALNQNIKFLNMYFRSHSISRVNNYNLKKAFKECEVDEYLQEKLSNHFLNQRIPSKAKTY